MFIAINSIVNATSEGVVQLISVDNSVNLEELENDSTWDSHQSLEIINWRNAGKYYHEDHNIFAIISQSNVLIGPTGQTEKPPIPPPPPGQPPRLPGAPDLSYFMGSFPPRGCYNDKKRIRNIWDSGFPAYDYSIEDCGLLISPKTTDEERFSHTVLAFRVTNYKKPDFGHLVCRLSIDQKCLTLEVVSTLNGKREQYTHKMDFLDGLPGFLNFSNKHLGPIGISDSEYYTCYVFDIVIGHSIMLVYNQEYNVAQSSLSGFLKEFASWVKTIGLMGIRRIPGAGPFIALVIDKGWDSIEKEEDSIEKEEGS